MPSPTSSKMGMPQFSAARKPKLPLMPRSIGSLAPSKPMNIDKFSNHFSERRCGAAHSGQGAGAEAAGGLSITGSETGRGRVVYVPVNAIPDAEEAVGGA